MAKKLGMPFKDNELEMKIYDFLKQKSVLIGESNYIKQLKLEKCQKKKRLYQIEVFQTDIASFNNCKFYS